MLSTIYAYVRRSRSRNVIWSAPRVLCAPACLPPRYAEAMKSLIFCLLFLCSLPALAACLDQARTDYEKLFCKIQQTSQGKSLPSFEDFRRNSPTVQALLLKRPAERLGLTMPAAPKAVKKAAVPAKPALEDKPSPTTKALPPTARTPLNAPPEVKQPVVTPEARLSGCSLQGEQVRCPKARYQLLMNKPNRDLAAGALGPENRFGLAAYQGKANDAAALRNYLGRSYQHYIEKMLEIGLGASTMSYTKFYYTYQEVSSQGEDFAARFEKMYEFLKKDKASMAIKARYDDKVLARIEQCVDLSAELVVCDNGVSNWVFQRDN